MFDEQEEALTILVHGPAGAGKTSFAATGPKPIILFDAERASKFIQLRKVRWDPMREAPPVYDGSWDMCVIKIRNWETAQKGLEYLKTGNHPFKTAVVDSISEIQIKAMENVNGRNQMQTQHWGKLLQYMGSFLRDLRDLMEEEDSPLKVMVLISTSKDYNGTFKPYLQGSIASQVPYLFDLTAYLYVNQVQDNLGNVTENRYLFTGAHPQYEAKSRVPGLPPTIENPHLEGLFNGIFGKNVAYQAVPHPAEAAAAEPVPPVQEAPPPALAPEQIQPLIQHQELELPSS